MRTKPTPKTFSGRVERLAEVLQVSVRTLSVEVGLSHSGLSAAMRAEGCTMATLHELHARTGVDLNWLVSGDGDMGALVAKRPSIVVWKRSSGDFDDPIVPCPNEPKA